MAEPHFYEVNVEWKRDRIGEISSPDLNDTFEVATPPEFPKGVAGIWSPEHLYAGAINSCYMTTFLAIAENSNLEFTSFSCKTICKLEVVEGKFMISEAVVEPKVDLVHPEKDNDRAIRILEKSEKACLISNSIQTVVTLKHRLTPTV
ncbi:MAG: OsmC family protein [Brumimicrobium sp.]|nr:OsmC family protein [Brumimicrobium sp.]MCO5269970.1 OsmC family protein [Brumimicrobium sp.]